MRLIDADKIDYIMEDEEKPNSLDYVRRSHIAEEPTVKAIPIEWIEKWVDKKTGTRIGDEIGYLEEDKKLLIGFIYWLVRDWEKENEQKTSD